MEAGEGYTGSAFFYLRLSHTVPKRAIYYIYGHLAISKGAPQHKVSLSPRIVIPLSFLKQFDRFKEISQSFLYRKKK
jgi:hypothetical protein